LITLILVYFTYVLAYVLARTINKQGYSLDKKGTCKRGKTLARKIVSKV